MKERIKPKDFLYYPFIESKALLLFHAVCLVQYANHNLYKYNLLVLQVVFCKDEVVIAVFQVYSLKIFISLAIFSS